MSVSGNLLSSLFSFFISILSLVAYWHIYSKAGEEGWKAIIPIYATYILYKLTWDLKMFWIMFGCCTAGFFMLFLGVATGLILVGFLGLIVVITGFVISFFQRHALSTSFGHGLPFTLGLLFLTPVFLLILAFGSSEYQGPQS